MKYLLDRVVIFTVLECCYVNLAFCKQIVKPFLDTKTAKKVKLVRSTDPASMKLVNDLFDSSTLEELLREDHFNLEEVAKQMRQDDAKFGLRRKLADERQERVPDFKTADQTLPDSSLTAD